MARTESAPLVTEYQFPYLKGGRGMRPRVGQSVVANLRLGGGPVQVLAPLFAPGLRVPKGYAGPKIQSV